LVGVGLSRLVFMRILSDALSSASLDVVLGEGDREQLYQELLYYFGLVGGLNVCEALEHAWRETRQKLGTNKLHAYRFGQHKRRNRRRGEVNGEVLP